MARDHHLAAFTQMVGKTVELYLNLARRTFTFTTRMPQRCTALD